MNGEVTTIYMLETDGYGRNRAWVPYPVCGETSRSWLLDTRPESLKSLPPEMFPPLKVPKRGAPLEKFAFTLGEARVAEAAHEKREADQRWTWLNKAKLMTHIECCSVDTWREVAKLVGYKEEL